LRGSGDRQRREQVVHGREDQHPDGAFQ
jgi:hypothetical protein